MNCKHTVFVSLYLIVSFKGCREVAPFSVFNLTVKHHSYLKCIQYDFIFKHTCTHPGSAPPSGGGEPP